MRGVIGEVNATPERWVIVDCLLPLPTDEVELMIRGVRRRWEFGCGENWGCISLNEQENLVQDFWWESVDGCQAVLKSPDLAKKRLQGIGSFGEL